LWNRDFLEGYANLLGFVDIFKKLSKIYEIDLSYKINRFIDGFNDSIKQLNNELSRIADKLEEATHLRHNVKFSIETFVDSMTIHLEEIKPIMGETETHYFDEFKKIFGDEF
jgi:transcription initiation factor TFIIIB Brf1 subunit/transcription initiation factor TFIIB